MTGDGVAFRSALPRIIARMRRRIDCAFSVSSVAANAGVMTDLSRAKASGSGVAASPKNVEKKSRAAPAALRSSSFSSSRRFVERSRSAS